MSLSKMLFGYLHSRRWAVVLLLLVAGVLLMVSGLYNQSPIPLLYGLIISAMLVLLFACVDCAYYCRTVQQLHLLRQQAEGHLEEPPPARDLREQLVNEALSQLEQRCDSVGAKAEQQRATTARYYTLWSHQVKTPLAAMRLLLQEEELDRGTLAQELFKIEQYVDMALQYQRLGEGPADLVLRSYPLQELVKQAVKEVSTLFIHKRVGLQLGELGGSVLTDKKWLLFVLEQLLTNAVKYTPMGGVVKLYRQGDNLLLCDNGIGIAPDDLPRVFEWGYTGGNGREEARATGVGLSLCKRTLTMLGHSITIESQLGNGTTVTLGIGRAAVAIE